MVPAWPSTHFEDGWPELRETIHPADCVNGNPRKRGSLEEFYARKLGAYYEALTIGPSHNDYLGRAKSDITKWVEHFCEGVSESFDNVKRRAEEADGANDISSLRRKLDPRQRKAMELFRDHETITSRDIEGLFSVSQRTARHLLQQWVNGGFLLIADPAKKSRKYALSGKFREQFS